MLYHREYIVLPKMHAYYLQWAYDRSTISAKLNFQPLKTQISFSELRLASQTSDQVLKP